MSTSAPGPDTRPTGYAVSLGFLHASGHGHGSGVVRRSGSSHSAKFPRYR